MNLLQEPSALISIIVIILLLILLLVIIDHRKTNQVSVKLDNTNTKIDNYQSDTNAKLDFFHSDISKEIKKQQKNVQNIMAKVDELHSCK